MSILLGDMHRDEGAFLKVYLKAREGGEGNKDIFEALELLGVASEDYKSVVRVLNDQAR